MVMYSINIEEGGSVITLGFCSLYSPGPGVLSENMKGGIENPRSKYLGKPGGMISGDRDTSLISGGIKIFPPCGL